MCQVYSHTGNIKGKCVNSWQFPEYFGIFGSGLNLEGIARKFLLYNLYLRKNLLATAGNLKVNENTNYKSVPIFYLFLAIVRKPEIRNY